MTPTAVGVDRIDEHYSQANEADCDDGKMNARVQMLDDSIVPFQLKMRDLGQALFDMVCQHLNLLEVDYFGLEYQDEVGVTYWLDYEKQLGHQLGLVDPLFRLCVKFYVSDPSEVEEEYTRYLMSLQVRRDLAVGQLQCNDNTAALIISYIVQGEVGDYVCDEYADNGYLSAFKCLTQQDDELERRVVENHKKHTGLSPAEADLNLLETARRCELYGMKMHAAKDNEGVPVNLAVGHMGVVVFQNYSKLSTFSWTKVRKLSFKRRKFLIKMHPEGFGYYKDTLEFWFEERNHCKNFWKKCVEHHTFFRCSSIATKPNRERRRILSRGSSFRYSGRTQKEMQEFLRESCVKRPISFHRGGRRIYSSSLGNVSQSISAQPLLPIGENGMVGGQSMSVSCGQLPSSSVPLHSFTSPKMNTQGMTSFYPAGILSTPRRTATATTSATTKSIDTVESRHRLSLSGASNEELMLFGMTRLESKGKRSADDVSHESYELPAVVVDTNTDEGIGDKADHYESVGPHVMATVIDTGNGVKKSDDEESDTSSSVSTLTTSQQQPLRPSLPTEKPLMLPAKETVAMRGVDVVRGLGESESQRYFTLPSQPVRGMERPWLTLPGRGHYTACSSPSSSSCSSKVANTRVIDKEPKVRPRPKTLSTTHEFDTTSSCSALNYYASSSDVPQTPEATDVYDVPEATEVWDADQGRLVQMPPPPLVPPHRGRAVAPTRAALLARLLPTTFASSTESESAALSARSAPTPQQLVVAAAALVAEPPLPPPEFSGPESQMTNNESTSNTLTTLQYLKLATTNGGGSTTSAGGDSLEEEIATCPQCHPDFDLTRLPPPTLIEEMKTCEEELVVSFEKTLSVEKALGLGATMAILEEIPEDLVDEEPLPPPPDEAEAVLNLVGDEAFLPPPPPDSFLATDNANDVENPEQAQAR